MRAGVAGARRLRVCVPLSRDTTALAAEHAHNPNDTISRALARCTDVGTPIHMRLHLRQPASHWASSLH